MRRLLIFVFFLIAPPLYAQQPVKVVDATGTDVPVATTTEAAHDTALGTITLVKALLDMCRARDTEPSAVSTADDAVLGVCNLIGARGVFPTANSWGGDLTRYQATTASTNAKSCKATAGTVYEVPAVNTTSTTYYLRAYDLAGGTPTRSSATGYVESIPVPQASGAGGGIVRTYPVGRAFTAGIGWCVTGGASSTDNTNAASGVYVTMGYK